MSGIQKCLPDGSGYGDCVECVDGSGGLGGSTSAGGSGGTTTGAGGTGGGSTTTDTSGTGGGSTTTGMGGGPGPKYPAGPYDLDIGATIDNYGFEGYPAGPSVAAVTVQLGDFYNPTGQGTYPPGSPYAFGPLPKRLLIHVGAVWSPPSNSESNHAIPPAMASYATCLQVIDMLIDGSTPGEAATLMDAEDWAYKYLTTYPVVIDPEFQFSSVVPEQFFPVNLLIDTTSMEILDLVTGVVGTQYFIDNVDPVCP